MKYVNCYLRILYQSKTMFIFLALRQAYALILEPTEEMIRERRQFFNEREVQFQLPLGSMNHFWIMTDISHITSTLPSTQLTRFNSPVSSYLGLILAGKANLLLSYFYKTRFKFVGRGIFDLGRFDGSVFMCKRENVIQTN